MDRVTERPTTVNRDMFWASGWAIGRFFYDAARMRLPAVDYPWWLFPDDPGYATHKAHCEEAQAYWDSLGD